MQRRQKIIIAGLPTNFKVIKKIGSGAYGCVYAAKDINANRIVAIKIIKQLFENLIDAKRVLREVWLLRQMNSPNVVKMLECNYLGRKRDFDSIYIVMEYHKKDLRHFMMSQDAFTLEQAKKLIYNILWGVFYIHSSKLLHRDIKPDNILVDGSLNVKFCDFGLARSIAEFEEDSNSVQDKAMLTECTLNKRSWYTVSEILTTDFTDEKSDKSLNLRYPISDGLSSPEIKLEHEDINLHDSSSDSSLNEEHASTNVIVQALKSKVKDISKNMLANKPKRKLTSHVVTRWYRSPEIILMEKDYSYGVDTWAVGCIIGEILEMISPSKCNPKSKPLFPGYCCYPLSPADEDQWMIDEFPYNQNDQLSYILDLVGSPDPISGYGFISDKQALKYLKNLPKSSTDKFSLHFPEADNESIDLLKKLLTFDPTKRISIEECLKHPFFDGVIGKEQWISKSEPINIEFEQELSMKLDEDKLRDYFLNEFKIDRF